MSRRYRRRSVGVSAKSGVALRIRITDLTLQIYSFDDSIRQLFAVASRPKHRSRARLASAAIAAWLESDGLKEMIFEILIRLEAS